jgi:formylglycine-generating enzyme required for sulfatase activity
VLPQVLAETAQRAPLDVRLAAARALGAGDPRIGAAAIIPAGSFWMGSGPQEGQASERPRRQLALAAYSIDLVPVTVAQFAQFVARGYRERECWSEAGWAWRQTANVDRPRFWDEEVWSAFLAPNQPVVGVSWFEADACARMMGRRLPTEAEWERAARGDEGRRYPWGDDWAPDRAAHRGLFRHTVPVGCFPAGRSPFGLWDVAGNVWEWVADWYAESGYRAGEESDPLGPAAGTLKVARGGAWNALPPQLRCATRNAWSPEARYSNIGFRTAGSVRR